jgi:hypothetical protein
MRSGAQAARPPPPSDLRIRIARERRLHAGKECRPPRGIAFCSSAFSAAQHRERPLCSAASGDSAVSGAAHRRIIHWHSFRTAAAPQAAQLLVMRREMLHRAER